MSEYVSRENELHTPQVAVFHQSLPYRFPGDVITHCFSTNAKYFVRQTRNGANITIASRDRFNVKCSKSSWNTNLHSMVGYIAFDCHYGLWLWIIFSCSWFGLTRPGQNCWRDFNSLCAVCVGRFSYCHMFIGRVWMRQWWLYFSWISL